MTISRRWAAVACLLVLDGALVAMLTRDRPAEPAGVRPVASGHLASLGPGDPRVSGVFAVLKAQGLSASLGALEQAAARDSAVLRSGHQLAHALGRLAVSERAGDGAVIRECRPLFGSGCYHGVVEGALQARGRIDMAELQRMCAGAGGADQPGPVYECVHGLGHGILGAEGYDIEAALHLCDGLAGPRFVSSCHAGAFMEAISTALGGAEMGMAHEHRTDGRAHGDHMAQAGDPSRRLSIDPHDPYSPCDRFADPYADSCWLFQGFIILRQHGFEGGEAMGICDRAPDGRADRCYESIGHQLTGLFQREDAWIVRQCARGRPDLAPRCAAGATLALNAIDWSGSRSARFCAATPTEWKPACYGAAARSLTDLASPRRRAGWCDRIEPDYAAVCRREAAIADRGTG